MEHNIGLRIRTLREQAGLTQEELAEKMDVSRQAVSKWEANLSRPSSENLIRLSRLLGVELWELIGLEEREELAAEEEETPRQESGGPFPGADREETVPPCEGKRTQNNRRWLWVILFALVAAVALFGSPLTAMLFMINTKEPSSPHVSVQVEPEVVETELPYSLALDEKVWYDFTPYTNYGSTADPSVVEEGLLFQYRWPHTPTTIVFYRELSSYRGEGGDEELYHLYAAYTNEDRAYTIIARISEDRADAGAPVMAAFEALGYRGCKVETVDEFGECTFFFGLDEESTPRLLYMTPGKTVEWDIDGDGENELAFLDHPEGILFADRGVEDYAAYTLADPLPEGGELEIEAGAFHLHVPGQGGRSFVYFWNGELVPVRYSEDGSFGVYPIHPDVADTVITFLGEDWADEDAPDAPFGALGGMPTHRQLAYIGLQTLYDLTGQRVERCYAVATDYGVTFSLDRNLDHHSFFSFDRTAGWSGNEMVVGGVSHIAWREENTPWSPILPVEAGDARWVYDHVPLLQEGQIAKQSFGLGSDVRLHLDDGSFYEVSFDGPQGLPSRIQGLYPPGFEH